MNWHSYQINILVHITYWSNSNSNAYDEDSKILTEYHFYFSDDCKHDSKFVQHCFGLHWRYISEGLSPRWHYAWSNGCANQFKSSKPWYFVSRYPNMISGCKMMWNFSRSGHGKGPHDGVGTIINQFI
jgi:hypothetical protein